MGNTDLVSNLKTVHPDHFALIIGAMKSGTTSLFEILGQHPQICSSKLKEPDYFTKDREKEERENYLDLWKWNDDLQHVALESSVAYAKAPFVKGVPERIYKSGFGDYRFIYMLRNPLTRIESQARHAQFAGWGKSLDAGIAEDLIDFSRYAMQIDQYLEYFPLESIFIVTLEEFQANPHAVLTRICKFLEVDDKFRFSRVAEPRNSGEFFNAPPGIAKVTQRGLGKFIARKILPPRVKNWLRTRIANMGKKRGTDLQLARWKLNDEESNLILGKLAYDMKRLEQDFGVEVQKYWHIPQDVLDRG